jgi:hypothetical protein
MLKVKVDGFYIVHVPREGVELMWFHFNNGWMVNCQCHLQDQHTHEYFNVVMKKGDTTIVFEILETGEPNLVKKSEEDCPKV